MDYENVARKNYVVFYITLFEFEKTTIYKFTVYLFCLKNLMNHKIGN